MSESEPKQGVSPVRKALSAVVLIGLLAVLGIELRAVFGHNWSMSALTEAGGGEDGAGALPGISKQQAVSMLSFAPTETLVSERETENEYRYSWFSLLRKGQFQVFLVTDKHDPANALRFSTEEGDMVVGGPPTSGSDEMSDMLPGDPLAAGGPGGGFGGAGGASGGFGGSDGGGSGGGGQRRPPADPLVTALDADGDGEISAEELENAPAALLGADADGDGTISQDDLRPEGGPGGGPGGGGGERRRPALETEEDTPETETPDAEPDASTETSEEPAEEAAPENDTAPESPATDKPADSPATDSTKADADSGN